MKQHSGNKINKIKKTCLQLETLKTNSKTMSCSTYIQNKTFPKHLHLLHIFRTNPTTQTNYQGTTAATAKKKVKNFYNESLHANIDRNKLKVIPR